MEQLKPFIDGLKANQFWIFCGGTLIACVVVYYMVNGNMNKEETAATGKITTTANTAQSLSTAGVPVNPEEEDGGSQTAHPNADTNKEMEAVVKVAAAATKEAWDKKYQMQSKYQTFDKETIEERNVDFQQYLPAEKVPFSDKEEEGMLPENVRVNYRDRIREELPKLAGMIRSYWKPNLGKNAATPREVIIWNEDNQSYWNSRFTNFVSEWNYQAEASNLPRTLQVLYTTEDLWLLRSILGEMIGKTVFDKGDVYANDLSVIKEIDHILIGKDAEKAEGEGTKLGGGGGGASGGSSSSEGMAGGMGMPMGGGGGGARARGKASLDPIDGRYVDNTGKDIPASEYRSIYANQGSTDKTKMHWKIAKRVKVRIGLQMDTREVQNFLANCANASFPIEVHSLRIAQHEPSKLKGSGKASGSGGMGGGSDAFDDGPVGAGGGSMKAPQMGGGGAAADEEIDDQGYVKPVEIYGYMYIYNPVDESMFKILKDKVASP